MRRRPLLWPLTKAAWSCCNFPREASASPASPVNDRVQRMASTTDAESFPSTESSDSGKPIRRHHPAPFDA